MRYTTRTIIRSIILVILALSITHSQQKKVILQEIRVKDGDTLWSIANYYLKDPRAWPEILKYNKLHSSDPNVILPGMKLKVPVKLVKEHLRPAYLTYLLNDVRFRKKGAVKWKKGYQNLELFNDDGIRTMTQSGAHIRFITNELVKLDENSLVILRPEKPREELKLFSGAVRASRAKILTDGAVVNPKITPKSPKPDFKTKVKEDKTTLVEVYEGIVDVSAQGKTVTLTKGFGTEVKYLSPPSLPRALPPLPEFEASSKETEPITRDTLSLNLSQRKYAKVMSKLKVTQCHLQIAADKKFNKLVVNETKYLENMTDFELQKYNLKDGKYYYRVAYVDELGFESKFTQPELFVIDATPPKLEILQPQENEKVTGEFIRVEGKTEIGTIVRVNDKILNLNEDGKFSTAIPARVGRNRIIIIAKDTAGNYTQAERNVYQIRKSAKKKKTTGIGKMFSIKPPEWLKTPTGIFISVTTFLVIVGVIVNIILP